MTRICPGNSIENEPELGFLVRPDISPVRLYVSDTLEASFGLARQDPNTGSLTRQIPCFLPLLDFGQGMCGASLGSDRINPAHGISRHGLVRSSGLGWALVSVMTEPTEPLAFRPCVLGVTKAFPWVGHPMAETE